MKEINEIDIDRIIEMAWEDRTPFEAIEFQFKISEKDIIKLMRTKLKNQVSNYGVKEFIVKLVKNIYTKEILILLGLSVHDNELYLIIKLVKISKLN